MQMSLLSATFKRVGTSSELVVPALLSAALLTGCAEGTLKAPGSEQVPTPTDAAIAPNDGGVQNATDSGAAPSTTSGLGATFPLSSAAPYDANLTLDAYSEKAEVETPVPDEAIDQDTDFANGSERLYLSGRGFDDPVEWDFAVTSGRNSEQWSKIGVPSNWEFYDFGTYRYGALASQDETGLYRTHFDVPEAWRNQRVKIVFEGAMTDTQVLVNGKLAGPTHQGAFYRFAYEITDLLEPGTSNLLEVNVAKDSANASVNAAERRADYWVFGGLFRPVYLEVLPQQFIERIATHPKPDGSLSVAVFLEGLSEDAEVIARLFDAEMNPFGESFSSTVEAGGTELQLAANFDGILPWSAESPTRYRLAVELVTASGARHQLRENIGFRSVEVRPGDGIYINNKRVVLRGVNRHSFWPNSGRALSETLSSYDVRLIKSMNINAVRSSHYPPDKHFLDLCDRLGLYVLDELAGWQAAYDTEVGRQLIQEMVSFDVNHPSIIFWDNGNEDGWNLALDRDFSRWDPQARSVLHPKATFSSINTIHYRGYAAAQHLLQGPDLFMSTEFMHGLYDGGHGAGLHDYWELIHNSPYGAGGFLWAFIDEGARHTDTGLVDAQLDKAADGILGPYREREASYYSVRDIFSPVQIPLQDLPPDFTGALELENRYDFTDLNTVEFSWSLLNFDANDVASPETVLSSGTLAVESIPPGASGTLTLPLPTTWREAASLRLEARDANGSLISTWSWWIASPEPMSSALLATASLATPTLNEEADVLRVSAGTTEFSFNAATGALTSVSDDGQSYSFGGGPTPSVGEATLTNLEVLEDVDGVTLDATFSGNLDRVRWHVASSGWLSLTYNYTLNGEFDFFGVDFVYPEEQVTGIRWLGKGPHRVWKNRMRGPWLGVWQRAYNDTVTGQDWNYPEFKGYFADVRWATLTTSEGPIHMVVEADDLFLRLYTPGFGSNAATATAPFPEKDISFLHAISPMGTNFNAATDLGPEGAAHSVNGSYEATLHFYFGEVATLATPPIALDAAR